MARGHSKSMFARNFKFLTPFRPCSSLFLLHAPPSMYFYFIQLPPLSKKSSATLMKTEKRINFFVDSKDKRLMFFTQSYMQ